MSATVNVSDSSAAGGWRYDGVARALHWLVVAMLVVQYSVALLLGLILPKSAEDALIQWHFGMGSSVLVVMVVRLLWRLSHPPPPPPADLSPGLRLLSRGTHWLFYAGFIVLPVLGWAAASSLGARVRVAGLIPLPLLVPKDDPFGTAMRTVHPAIAITLLAFIALHIAGALYHALVKRDGVLGRMLPGRGGLPS